MTDGTAKINYITKEHNTDVLGMKDVPIIHLISDMSASEDGTTAVKNMSIFCIFIIRSSKSLVRKEIGFLLHRKELQCTIEK